MKSRLYILLVLASIAQSAYVPTLQVYYGLSEQQVAVLNENRANQYAVENIVYDALKTIIQVLCGLGADSDKGCSKVFDAVVGMEKAAYLTLDSIQLIVKDSCSAIEIAREATHGNVQNSAVTVQTACKLATSGNYWKTRNKIEILRTTAQEGFKTLVGGMYDLVSTCLNIRDSDAIAVIKNARNQSFVNGAQWVNGIFNAVKLRAATTTELCEDRDFITDLEDFENKALFGVKQHIEYQFTTLSTFYIYDCLQKHGISPQLAANQYALSESLRGYQDGDDIYYYRIIRYLQHICLGLSDDGKLDFSQDDGNAAEEIAHYDAGDSSNLASMKLLHPKSDSKIAAVRKIIFEINAVGTQGLYDLVHEAMVPGANYSRVMADIETGRGGVADIARNFTESYFSIIRNNQCFNKKLDAELKLLLKTTIANILDAVDAYVDAIVVLANATHRGKVSKDDISAVLACRDAGSEANDKVAQGISAASLLVLLSQNNNKRGYNN